ASSPEAVASDAVRRRNCLGCHTRDGQGGRDLAGRLAALLAEDRALGGLKGTLTPPNLSAVGDKPRPEDPAPAVRGRPPTARAWLAGRRPAFAFEPGEADAIAAASRTHARSWTEAELDPEPGRAPASPAALARLDPAAREAAARLIGQRGFGCVSCHVLAGR